MDIIIDMIIEINTYININLKYKDFCLLLMVFKGI